jgi:hypothetical protein
MKKLTYTLFMGLLIISAACVDDYTDANPPARLDAPTIRLSTPSNGSNTLVNNPLNAFQSEPEVFMTYTAPLVFTVSVIDAPGKIGEVSVTSSIPEYGTLTVDEASVASLQNQESGSFNFTFTPSPDFEDDSDRSLNIEVNVSDQQLDEDGESAPKTTTLVIPVNMATCVSDAIAPGYYMVTEMTANLDGGTAITLADLEGALGERVVVEIDMERPGLYTVNEVTGGVWPVAYPGRASPVLQVDVCGNAIQGREGAVTAGAGTAAARTFTLAGTANENGTINMTWSYVRNDGATPLNPAKGTYTLSRIGGF